MIQTWRDSNLGRTRLHTPRLEWPKWQTFSWDLQLWQLVNSKPFNIQTPYLLTAMAIVYWSYHIGIYVMDAALMQFQSFKLKLTVKKLSFLILFTSVDFILNSLYFYLVWLHKISKSWKSVLRFWPIRGPRYDLDILALDIFGNSVPIRNFKKNGTNII